MHLILCTVILERYFTEYSPVRPVHRHKSGKHGFKNPRNVRHTNKFSNYDDDELPISLSRDIDTRSEVSATL